jgi:flagellar FliL protein
MASKDKQAPKTEDEADEAEGEQSGEAEQGFVKKLLGNKKLLMIAGGALLLVLAGGGAGLYFLVFAGTPSTETAQAQAQAVPITPPQVAFFDLPDLTGNIQTADGTPVYLKLSLALELDTADEKAGITVLEPRINDQIMGYLHELRVDDIKGSAGIMRLKEELLRRINVAAAPYRVRDVLLKEMIFQ